MIVQKAQSDTLPQFHPEIGKYKLLNQYQLKEHNHTTQSTEQ